MQRVGKGKGQAGRERMLMRQGRTSRRRERHMSTRCSKPVATRPRCQKECQCCWHASSMLRWHQHTALSPCSCHSTGYPPRQLQYCCCCFRCFANRKGVQQHPASSWLLYMYCKSLHVRAREPGQLQCAGQLLVHIKPGQPLPCAQMLPVHPEPERSRPYSCPTHRDALLLSSLGDEAGGHAGRRHVEERPARQQQQQQQQQCLVKSHA